LTLTILLGSPVSSIVAGTTVGGIMTGSWLSDVVISYHGHREDLVVVFLSTDKGHILVMLL
jgi:hypothetical protein